MLKFLRRQRGMSCDEIMTLLQGYLDGEVAEDTARDVARHLHKCNNCAPEAEAYSSIKKSLAAKDLVVDPIVLANLQIFAERVKNGEFD